MPGFSLSISRNHGSCQAFPTFDEPGLRTYFSDDSHCLIYGDSYRFDPRRAGEAAALGGFSRITQCQKTGRIEIASDPSAAYPLYVALEDDRVVAATDLPHLLEALGRVQYRPDAKALEQLLAFGQLLGSRTTLENVIHLSGGAEICIDGTACRQVEAPIVQHSGEDEQADQIVERLAAVVADQARQVQGQLLLPISGGLDTRLILAACFAAGIRPELCVFGAPGSADRTIAEAIANAFGLTLRAFDIEPAIAVSRAPMVAMASGGELPLQHGHALLADGFIEAIKGRALMVGTGGETFRAFYYDRGMPGFSLLGQQALKSPLKMRARRWVSEHVLNHADDVPAQLKAELTDEIDRILDAAPDLARGLDQVYLQMRVRRAVIAGQQIMNTHCLRLHPLLDKGLQASFATLPIRWRLGGSFHRYAIQRLSPALAEIAWDRTSRPLSNGLTWRERWPGLANRLGFEGAYAKAGAPLGDYRDMLASAGLHEMIASLDHRKLLTDASRAMLRSPTPGRVGALKSFACWVRQSERSEVDVRPERIPA